MRTMMKKPKTHQQLRPRVQRREAHASAPARAVSPPVFSGLGLLASQAPASGSGGVAIQREEKPKASVSAPFDEPLLCEGDEMRKAVLDAAQQRTTDKTTIMSEEEIGKIRKGYTQEYKVKVDGKDETRTRTIPPMANYTTCVEFAGQTYADAINKRSKAVGRNRKESTAAGRLLSDTKRALDGEYQLQAEIDSFKATMQLNRASLGDPTKPDRRGRPVYGPVTRLEKAVKEGEDLKDKKKKLEEAEAGLTGELKALVDAKAAAKESGDKDRASALEPDIQKKKGELQKKHQEVLQTQGQMVGQAQTIKQLKAQIAGVDREWKKLKAMVDGRQTKLDELRAKNKQIIEAKAPLTTHPKRGEYVLLGAGAKQGYGVSKETTVTLGKGAFKHIAVFDSIGETTSAPGNKDEKWQTWNTIDGGGIKSDTNSIKVCLNDLRVAPGKSENPWFASKTTLIGWVDMNKLVEGQAPAKPADAAQAPAGASPSAPPAASAPAP